MRQGPRLQYFPSARLLGNQLCAEIEAGASAEGRLIALAVGRSTLPHYAGLDPDAAALEEKVFLPVDELVPAPARSRKSFSAQLRAGMPAKLSEVVYEIEVGDPAQAALGLERRIEASGLALCVLGLGPDGHVAFNQPGSGPETRTRVVEILPENLCRLGEVAPATHALTLGIASLLAAERIVLVVDGSGKERALERVIEGPEGSDLPASWLRSHRDCQVLVVAEAAGRG